MTENKTQELKDDTIMFRVPSDIKKELIKISAKRQAKLERSVSISEVVVTYLSHGLQSGELYGFPRSVEFKSGL